MIEQLIKDMNFQIIEANHHLVGVNRMNKKIGHDWTSDIKNPFHFLNYHRIYCPVEGSGTITTINGQVSIKPGNLYFIAANSIVSTQCPGFLDHYFIHFTCTSCTPNIFSAINLPVCISNHNKGSVFEKIISSFNKNSLSAYFEAKGAFFELISCFFDQAVVREEALHFITVIDHIEKHFAENITLSTLSSISNMSHSYFIKSFKACWGLSPMQYLLNYRINIAQKYLANSDLSIKEIAAICGFENQFYFSRLFVKKTGSSPSAYRKSFATNFLS